jgi:hypothetical protein
MNSNIYVFRSSELEIVDLYSGINQIVPIDFLGDKTIIKTPIGILFGGISHIYIVPSDGSAIKPFNEQWANLYNGDLLNDFDKQYVTSVYRQAMNIGYDENYNEIWFQIKVNADSGINDTEYLMFRYSIISNKWNAVRKLNIGNLPVKYFANSKENYFNLGFEDGILLYPNREGNYSYEDNVLLASPYTQGTGIETSVTINLGKLYSLATNSVLYDIFIDFNAVGDVNSKFKVAFYYNDIETPFETMNFLINKKMSFPRKLKQRGQINKCKIKIYIDDADLTKIKLFELRKIQIGYIPMQNINS